jgi:hypothetical protein
MSLKRLLSTHRRFDLRITSEQDEVGLVRG